MRTKSKPIEFNPSKILNGDSTATAEYLNEIFRSENELFVINAIHDFLISEENSSKEIPPKNPKRGVDLLAFIGKLQSYGLIISVKKAPTKR